jgi:hypothetical protein
MTLTEARESTERDKHGDTEITEAIKRFIISISRSFLATRIGGL